MFWHEGKAVLKVAPSILSADFARLAEEIDHVTETGIDHIHIDVSDGVFVPEITIGAPVVKCLRKVTSAVLGVHLMTVRPEEKIAAFATAGADLITFHVEATDQAQTIIHKIKGAGCRAGIALNPATPLCMIEEVLDDVDVVHLMTAIPGFAGQPFLKSSIGKIKRLRAMIKERDCNCLIEVDGGINIETAKSVREAGANILVAGTAIYESSDVWASSAMILGE